MMFRSIRIKLTIWYALITLIVSTGFSIFLYRNVMDQVRQGIRVMALRAPIYTEAHLLEDQRIYEQIRSQVFMQLTSVNLFILGASTIAGYILAGKTLQPVETMVEDQKRFVGDASHELRTPLTSMKTEIEVAMRNRLTAVNAREILVSNLEEVNKMQALTTYLLSLTRYEQGSDKLVKEKVDISQSVQKAMQSLSSTASKKHIEVQADLRPVVIQANAASITELVTILLDNAIKYSSEDTKVLLRVKKTTTGASIEVEDFGMGIKASDLPYIFNRFYRADVSRSKEKVDGYGLGLSIAKNIVTIHGGTLSVKSSLGKGTIFKAQLPF